MSQKQPGKKGPDPIEINKEQVLELARMGWMVTAIAAFFRVSTDTLYRRVPAAEIDAARLVGGARLWQMGYQRAMGGKQETKNPDGSVTVKYHEGSNRMLMHMLDRTFGKVKQEVEINPNPQVPVNLRHEVDPESIKACVEKLNSEY